MCVMVVEQNQMFPLGAHGAAHKIASKNQFPFHDLLGSPLPISWRSILRYLRITSSGSSADLRFSGGMSDGVKEGKAKSVV